MFGEKSRIGSAPLNSRKIKNLRGEGIAYQEIACRVRQYQSAMQSYEQGDRKPKKKVPERVAIVLRARAEYLSAPKFCSETEFLSIPF